MVIVILALLGLCFGSFVNAFIWRFHEQEQLRWQREELRVQSAGRSSKVGKLSSRAARQDAKLQAELAKLSITKGRSMCIHCRHELAPKDLVPVVSYLWLRGKCRYCRQSIPDTPLSELLTPALFIVSYLFWPLGFSGAGRLAFGVWLVCLIGFVALSLYDLKWYELPHRIVLPLIGLAALGALVTATLYNAGTGGGLPSLARAAWGGLVGGGIFWLLYVISPAEPDDPAANEANPDAGLKPTLADRILSLVVGGKYSKWIGFGDITLGILLGLLVGGPANALLLIFVASLIGSLIAVPLLIAGRATRTSHLPFGPFLMAAAVVVKLFGVGVISWYVGHFL